MILRKDPPHSRQDHLFRELFRPFKLIRSQALRSYIQKSGRLLPRSQQELKLYPTKVTKDLYTNNALYAQKPHIYADTRLPKH